MGIEDVHKLVDTVIADKALRGTADAANIRKLQEQILEDGKVSADEVDELERLVASKDVTRSYLHAEVDPVAGAVHDLFRGVKQVLAKDGGPLPAKVDKLDSFLKRSFGYLDEPVAERYLPADLKQGKLDKTIKGLQQQGKLGKIDYQGVPAGEKLAVQYFLAKIAASDRGFNSESDIVIPLKRDQVMPRARYTVRLDEFGNATVKRMGDFAPAGVPAAWVAKTAEEAAHEREQKYGITIQAQLGHQPWSKEELGVLQQALEKLDPAEQKLMRGTVFARDKASDGLAGLQKMDEQGRNVITIYDAAFNNDLLHFSGDGQPDSVRTIVHEIGHRLSRGDTLWRAEQADHLGDAAYRANPDLKRYNEALLAYNKLAKAPATEGPDSPTGKEREQQLKKLVAEIDSLRPKVNALGPKRDEQIKQLAAARERFNKEFAQPFASHPSITAYAEHERHGGTGEEPWEEFYADAYSLYKLEPETLQKEYPELYEYFKSGKNLE